MTDHELSEVLRDESFECDEEMLEMVANMADQLEAKLFECRKLAKSYIDAYEKLAFEDGFFCQKCGTVYAPEIMACRTCHPKAYEKLTDALKEVDDVRSR